MQFHRYANVGLRSLTLASKFLLVFFLAKFLEPQDVGLYGLLAAAIGYAIYLVGFEFYTYSSRELIASSVDNRANIIFNQVLIYFILYAVAGVVLYLSAVNEILPGKYWMWVYILLVLEHVSQEINRVLISMSQQLAASYIMFVRMGLWGLVVIVSLWIFPDSRTIDFILIAWVCGVFIACVLGLLCLLKLLTFGCGVKIDPVWLINGLKVALPFFIASIAVRGIATFDRFFVEKFGGLEMLGVYVVYIGMATAVISFIDAGVVDFAYPKLIAAARARDRHVFSTEMKKAKDNILWLGVILIVTCGLGGYMFANILGKEVYIKNIGILYWLLIAAAFNAMSIVPHLGLYALGCDKAIIQSQVVGFAVFLVLTISLCGFFGVNAVLISVCAAWVSILAWKAAVYKTALFEFNC